jgi:hypothetical protein
MQTQILDRNSILQEETRKWRYVFENEKFVFVMKDEQQYYDDIKFYFMVLSSL